MEQPPIQIDQFYDPSVHQSSKPSSSRKEWSAPDIYRLEGPVDSGSAPVRRNTNPKSYASRVQARPDLSVETAPPSLADPAPISTSNTHESPIVSPSATLPSRQSSVADKSPLQKLEVALGDVSKAEKRARVQEAEQLAERRASQSGQRPDRTLHQSQRSRSAKKPNRVDSIDDTYKIPSGSTDRQYRDASGSGYYSASEDNGHSRAITRDASTRERVHSMSYDQTPSRTRQYGHDALLSGAAAAAALGVYQSSRHSRYLGPSSPSPNYSASQAGSQNTPIASRHYFQRGFGPSEWPEVRALDPSKELFGSFAASNAVGSGQAISQNIPIASRHYFQRGFGPNEWPEVRALDPSKELFGSFAASTAIRSAQTGDLGVNRSRSGRGTFADPMTPNEYLYHDQNREGGVPQDGLDPAQSGRHNFWGHHQGEARRYRSTRALEEWKSAGVAALIADDLKLDAQQEHDQAWWERNAANTSTRGQTNINASNAAYASTAANNQGTTSFEPKLLLKCGPLLRYTGIRRGDTNADGPPSTEIWRGSVMIVTEDAQSSYNTPPILRLFKQHKDLVAPRPHPDAYQNHEHTTPNQYDPIAGQQKISRRGETLFVRPAHLLQPETDLSQVESNEGLFDSTNPNEKIGGLDVNAATADGEAVGKYRDVQGFRLHVERGFTFWRFNIQVELGNEQTRIAYRINGGPATGFWVPAAGQSMNMMFHSCNGFSLSVDPNVFSGPDPLWRDVLNEHQARPFHVMIGGGDQIYNDAAMKHTKLFQEWLGITNPEHKHSAAFTEEMQIELDQFYFDRYAMWFSQGLFGLANSQIPMVNMWDDHDIIDGFGSYPDHFMDTPVFSGVGAVAFKYYCLFQHQSVPSESQETEPSWLLGASPGPYIKQLSRSVFISLGKDMALLGVDCRTERKRDEILSQESWDLIFDRCRQELVFGETKHLIVLLGVPIAYPRLNFLENVLTSKAMDPIKALGRAGLFKGFINRFDGGVEILDDLDDHWTAKHHKKERNWFIQELQELAAEKSVRITILGGDVHLGACGRFYSNPKFGIPKDRDHRYMPNVVSSAIVNTPPPDMMADIINKRDKVHRLDQNTSENMIPLFNVDVDGKKRNNVHLLPRRNWCSIKEYNPGTTPPPTPPPEAQDEGEMEEIEHPKRTLSLGRGNTLKRSTGNKGSLFRRLTLRGTGPPSSYIDHDYSQQEPNSSGHETRSLDNSYSQANQDADSGYVSEQRRYSASEVSRPENGDDENMFGRPSFHRRASNVSAKDLQKDVSGRQGHIDLERGLDITLHFEINQKDPLGSTVPYRLMVPALFYQGVGNVSVTQPRGRVTSFFGGLGRSRSQRGQSITQGQPYEANEFHEEPPRGGRAGGDPIPRGSADRSLGPDYAAQDMVDSSRPQTGATRSSGGFDAIDGQVNDQAMTNPSSSIPPQQNQSPTTNIEKSPAAAAVRDVSDEQPVRRVPSARGPKAPGYVDRLPASVKKRYSQFEPVDANGSGSYSGRPSSIPIPSSGLGPPLGQVNNRYYDETPRELGKTAVAGWDSELPRSTNQTRPSNDVSNATEPASRSADIQQLIAPAAHGRSKSKSHNRSSSVRASQPIIEAPINPEDLEASEPQRAATYHAPSSQTPIMNPVSTQYGGVPGPLTSAPVSAADTFLPPQHYQSPHTQDHYDAAEASLTPSPPLQEATRSRPSKLERHFGGYEEHGYGQEGGYGTQEQPRRKSARFSSMVRRFSGSGSSRRRD